ncbi:MAG: ROK family protein [Dysosmobacter welbionis]
MSCERARWCAARSRGGTPCASGSHPKRRRQRAWRSSRAVVRVFCAGWTSGYSGGLARTCRRTLRRRCGGRPLSGCWTRCCPGRLVYGPSAWRRICSSGPAGSRCVPRIRASRSPGAVRPPGIPGGHLPERPAGGEPVRQGPELPGRAVCQPGDRVGSAVLSGGQLCRGRGGRPLGLGHVTICAGGRPCRCGGRGCLELYVRSPEVLEKLYHRTGLEASYADFAG